jgi:hypothetical protein
MRLHPEDQTKSGLAPEVVIKPRQRLATAESDAGALDIVAVDQVAGDRPRGAPRRIAEPFRHPGATLRAGVFAMLVQSSAPWVDGVGKAFVRARTHPVEETCTSSGPARNPRQRPYPVPNPPPSQDRSSLSSRAPAGWRREGLISRRRGKPRAAPGRRAA